ALPICPLDDDPVVAGENASDLALVPFCKEFDAHSGIIADILFGSGYAGLGGSRQYRIWEKTARVFSIAWGSYARTLAPSAKSWLMISIDGANRISSVFGLKAKPSTPISLFLITHSALRIFSTNKPILCLLTRSTSFSKLTSTPARSPSLMKPCTSLGRQKPP